MVGDLVFGVCVGCFCLCVGGMMLCMFFFMMFGFLLVGCVLY